MSTQRIFPIGLSAVIACLAPLWAQAASSTGVTAEIVEALPRYESQQAVSGTIRTWGNENMKVLMKYWEEGFRKRHPEIRFEDNLKSTAAAIGALFSGVADVGLMGREIWPMEALSFKATTGYEALELTIVTGSYDVNSKTWPLVVYVNKDNPVSQLTLQQLDAIYGSEHLRGAPKNFRTWGDLGLTGEWANKPIHVYGYRVDSGFAFNFAKETLKGSGLWNGDLHQIGGTLGRSWDDDARRAVEIVGTDPSAILYTGISFRTPQVKALALAAQEGGIYFAPTPENVARRLYPLTRSVYLFINRVPGKPVDPKVKEFLRYILSREGQGDVIREGDYFPLTAEVLREQLKKLD